MLVKEVIDRYGDSVEMRIEIWGQSELAKKLRIDKYPAVIVNGRIFAAPADLGFYTTEKPGRYTPWPSEETGARFKKDLEAVIHAELAGEPWPAGMETIMP